MEMHNSSVLVLNNYIDVDNKNWQEKNSNTKKHFEESEKEAKSFSRDSNRKISDPSVVNERLVCPACESSVRRELFNKWGFVHYVCSSCKTIYVGNVLKNEILLSLYEKSLVDQYAFDRAKNKPYVNYWTSVYKKYIDYLLSHAEDKKLNILDFGCGSGLFVETLLRSQTNTKIEVFGTDYSEFSEGVLKQLIGSNYLHKASLDQLSMISGGFDIVTMWGVLEHLVAPKETLTSIKAIMNRGGLIHILIPNLNSAAYEILGIHTPTLNPRQHLNFFNRRSFTSLLNRLGFEVIIYGKELPVIDLMWEYLNITDELKEKIIEEDKSYYHVYVGRVRD